MLLQVINFVVIYYSGRILPFKTSSPFEPALSSSHFGILVSLSPFHHTCFPPNVSSPQPPKRELYAKVPMTARSLNPTNVFQFSFYLTF